MKRYLSKRTESCPGTQLSYLRNLESCLQETFSVAGTPLYTHIEKIENNSYLQKVPPPAPPYSLPEFPPSSNSFLKTSRSEISSSLSREKRCEALRSFRLWRDEDTCQQDEGLRSEVGGNPLLLPL